MTTWNTVSQSSTNWNDSVNYYDSEFYYDTDKIYETSEYNYDGLLETDNEFYTVSKASTTWS